MWVQVCCDGSDIPIGCTHHEIRSDLRLAHVSRRKIRSDVCTAISDRAHGAPHSNRTANMSTSEAPPVKTYRRRNRLELRDLQYYPSAEQPRASTCAFAPANRDRDDSPTRHPSSGSVTKRALRRLDDGDNDDDCTGESVSSEPSLEITSPPPLQLRSRLLSDVPAGSQTPVEAPASRSTSPPLRVASAGVLSPPQLPPRDLSASFQVPATLWSSIGHVMTKDSQERCFSPEQVEELMGRLCRWHNVPEVPVAMRGHVGARSVHMFQGLVFPQPSATLQEILTGFYCYTKRSSPDALAKYDLALLRIHVKRTALERK